MKNKPYLYITILFLILGSTLRAQPKLTEVRTGQRVPDLTLSGFLDDPSAKVKLSSLYQHKLLLLDFWATWCGSCLQELPGLDSIQNDLGGRVAIVAVGYQDRQTTSAFFKRRTDLQFKNIRFLAADSSLSFHVFPHRALPHLIWIDSTGVVVAITSGNAVTKQTVTELLNTGKTPEITKTDRMDFKQDEPFHLRDSSYLARSIFTNHTSGILSSSGGFGGDAFRTLNRISILNLPIRMLYWIAAFHYEICFGNYDRMVLEVKDSLKYMQPRFAQETYRKSKYYQEGTLSPDQWTKENVYCYELQLPESRIDTVVYSYMIADLNRYLNLNGRFEYREGDCYVLTYKKEGEKEVNRSLQKPAIIYNNSNPAWALDVPKELHAQPIVVLLTFLNMTVKDRQVVDETGLDPHMPIDFMLPGLKKGITAGQVSQMLDKYGLTLQRARRKVRMFVLSE